MNIKNILAMLYERRRQLIWLSLIIALGIFLRTYHFREFLIYVADQRRDLNIVRNVVENHVSWPLLGPDMTGGEGFRLGPMYYYFQIISAKIFGAGPVQQAFPDVFFAIFSIPLLYYFLGRYFCEKVALFSTGVYAFSFFAIEYSRYAWNVNLIPFFSLLFLVSFWHFMTEDEETAWLWVFLTGVSLGVGVQLHAIVFLLLPALTVCGSLYLIFVRGKHIGKKLLVILGLVLLLNTGQFISEFQTGFTNTQDFQKAFIFKSRESGSSYKKMLVLDMVCNAQANSRIISSLGNKKMCDFLYIDNLRDSSDSTPLALKKTPLALLGEAASLIFSILGIILLVSSFMNESDMKRKYFLGLLLLYGALYFCIMLPIAPGSRMRYYLPIIIMPFVFLSLFFDRVVKIFPRRHVWILSMVTLALFLANALALSAKFQHPLR